MAIAAVVSFFISLRVKSTRSAQDGFRKMTSQARRVATERSKVIYKQKIQIAELEECIKELRDLIETQAKEISELKKMRFLNSIERD